MIMFMQSTCAPHGCICCDMTESVLTNVQMHDVCTQHCYSSSLLTKLNKLLVFSPPRCSQVPSLMIVLQCSSDPINAARFISQGTKGT